MFNHLTQTQIEGYGKQKLTAGELLSVSDHLGVCESCRGKVERAGGDASFFTMHSEVFGDGSQTSVSPAGGTHLTVDQIAEYVDQITTGEELQVVQDHLSICERCDFAVNDIRDFKTQIAPTLNREYRPKSGHATSESWTARLLRLLPPQLARSPLAWSSALAVLLLTVTGWLVWQSQHKKAAQSDVAISTPPSPLPSVVPTYSPIPNVEGPAAPLVAQLNDAGTTVTLDSNGVLSGIDDLPTAYQRMVKDSLSNQRIAKSSLLSGLSRPGSSLMGGDELGQTFSVTGPVGKVLLADRPTFRWSELQGAKGYVVEVYDDKFNLVISSPELVGIKWTPTKTLKRGEVYTWQVKAIKDGREFTSPRPPAPQAKFRILDHAKAGELAQARRSYSSSHLTMGLLYAQAGLLDEAEKEFGALQRANPDSALARGLLRQVQKLRR